MEVITMESKAYKDLMDKICSIAHFVTQRNPESEDKHEEMWVDNYDVCKFLKISDRTLQRLRTKRLISYSIISGKSYYTIAEIKRILNEKLVRSDQERLNDLINNYKLSMQQRRANKK